MQSLSQHNFKVLIRVRPLNNREKQQISAYEQSQSMKMRNSNSKGIKLSPAAYSFYTKFYNCSIDEIIKIYKKNHTIAVADPQYKNSDRRMRPYTFSGVYDVDDANSTIFNQDLKSHITNVLDGYNCTILAYGITGSGKTHTVFGPSSKRQLTPTTNFTTFNANSQQPSSSLFPSSSFSSSPSQSQGISYLTFSYLLKQKHRLWQQNSIKINYKLSFIEIYNQNVRDLLVNDRGDRDRQRDRDRERDRDNKFLNVVEDNKGNTTISDVTEICIQNIQQIYQCINAGNLKRAFASTLANQYSSRSHAILQLMVEVEKSNTDRTVSKLYIIDLAGSEKIQTLNCSKKMLEGANINRSLLALGNCINLLAQNSKKNTISHIPYRDSKLTRMLKDSLGGNTKTIMIACISPNPFLIDETMTTLNYALRAQGIKKKISKNQIDCNDRKQKQDYLCLRCKRSSKDEEEMEIFYQRRTILQEKNRGLFKMRASLDLSSVPKVAPVVKLDQRKVQKKMAMLENLYQDIVNNIRESESLNNFGKGFVSNDPEWLKIKCVNQQQRIRLKQVLFDTMKGLFIQQSTFVEPSPRGSQTKPTSQNKQNRDTGDLKSLSESKTRRKRSHNKFEIVRKTEQDCKTLDFE